MNASSPELERMFQLADAVCNSTVSDAELAELDAVLLADEVACDYYLDYCCLHVALKLDAGMYTAARKAQEQISGTSRKPDPIACTSVPVSPAIPSGLFDAAWRGAVGFFSQEIPFACLIALVIMGVALAVCSQIYITHHQQFARSFGTLDVATPRPTPHAPRPSSVACITGMVDVKWGSGVRNQGAGTRGQGVGAENPEIPKSLNPESRTPSSPSLVVGDRLELSSGLLQLTYNSGAKVILQGPCTFEVNSAAGGFLALGKLTARVNSGQRTVDRAKPQASDIHHSSFSTHHSTPPSPLAPRSSPLFTVQTPTAVITDLGTEFGVEVDEQGGTTSHVFQGAVRLELTDVGRATESRVLNADESARAEIEDGRLVLVSVQSVAPDKFVRRLPPPDPNAGLRYKLAAYWSFDDATNLGRNLLGGGDLDPVGGPEYEPAGLLGGALRLHGMERKNMLVYQNNEGVPAGVPTGDSSYTISVWFRSESLHPGGTKAGIIGWGEPTPGRANVLAVQEHDDLASIINYWWTYNLDIDVEKAPLLSGWHHLAVTYDRPSKLRRLFLDGQWIGSRVLAAIPDVAPARFAIGRGAVRFDWPEYFDGLLDELAIWSRGLTEAEVSQLFNNGKGLNPLANSSASPETVRTDSSGK